MGRVKKIYFDFLLAGIIFLLVLSIFLMSSCKHQPTVYPLTSDIGTDDTTANGGGLNGGSNNCDPNTVYFQQQILPMIISNCAKSGCHNTEDHQEGIILNSYASIMSDGDIRSGNPGGSDLYQVITETDPDNIMPPPPHPALSSSQVNLVYQWIQQGAQNNSCENSCDTLNVTYSGSIASILQSSCVGCHSGSTPDGQINLTTHSGVSAVALDGRLIGSVNHSYGFVAMPKGGNQLSTCQLDLLRIWVNAGAQNN